jgi:GT2 family glycosyltransferase
MIEIISATRLTMDGFWSKSALGLSLRRLAFDSKRLAVHLAFQNSAGLPTVYNSRISTANQSEILLFVHDDVWIDDYFVADRVLAGLQSFDIIGVAGSRRRVPGQRAWHYIGPGEPQGREHLSGAVGHGKNPFGRVSSFGPAPAECELLDGVFLAVKLRTLLDRAVRFDPIFDFHFYDLDFCRSARQAGLRLGTWPICLTHQSGGNFESEAWTAAHGKYLQKWGD